MWYFAIVWSGKNYMKFPYFIHHKLFHTPLSKLCGYHGFRLSVRPFRHPFPFLRPQFQECFLILFPYKRQVIINHKLWHIDCFWDCSSTYGKTGFWIFLICLSLLNFRISENTLLFKIYLITLTPDSFS